MATFIKASKRAARQRDVRRILGEAKRKAAEDRARALAERTEIIRWILVMEKLRRARNGDVSAMISPPTEITPKMVVRAFGDWRERIERYSIEHIIGDLGERDICPHAYLLGHHVEEFEEFEEVEDVEDATEHPEDEPEDEPEDLIPSKVAAEQERDEEPYIQPLDLEGVD